jgi:hypothetical protein
MPSDLCLDALTALPGWLGPTAAAATVVLMGGPHLSGRPSCWLRCSRVTTSVLRGPCGSWSTSGHRAGRAHDRRRRSDGL